jgi:hypothetical protein
MVMGECKVVVDCKVEWTKKWPEKKRFHKSIHLENISFVFSFFEHYDDTK